MVTFIDALQAGPVLTDGAMGSYIFDRTGRLSRPGFLYEAQKVILRGCGFGASKNEPGI